MTEILEECPLDTVDGIERLNAAEQLPANWALLAADFRTEGRAARRLENKRDVFFDADAEAKHERHHIQLIVTTAARLRALTQGLAIDDERTAAICKKHVTLTDDHVDAFSYPEYN